jgi:peroxiredoxin
MPSKAPIGPLALLTAVLATSCTDPSPKKPTPTASAAPSAAPAASTSATAMKPRMKEIAAPPEARVGTLPPDIGVAVGQPAPDASLHDSGGAGVRLADLFSKGAVLLVFYRGGWCPFCNFQIHELTEAYPEYQKRGVTPVAISVDKQEEGAKTRATYTIPFPVLSDPDLVAHKAYRVLHHADDAEVQRLKGFGIDLEKSSGRDHHTFAVPALFLVDKTGKVRWAHADVDYKTRPRTKQILAAIDALGLTR